MRGGWGWIGRLYDCKILADHLYKERLGCYEHKVWMRGASGNNGNIM